MLQHTRMGGAARAFAITTALALAGCAGVGLVEVGEDHVEPFTLDRQFSIAEAPFDECPFGESDPSPSADADAVTVAFAPTRGGCLVDIRVSGAVLMRAAEVARRADRLEEKGDVDAVVGLDLEVRDLVLADEAEERLDLGGLSSLSVDVNGETVLREQDVVAMRSGTAPRISLPQSFVDDFIAAVEARETLTADLRLRVVVRDPDRSIPQVLHLSALLQPILLVDAIAAKL